MQGMMFKHKIVEDKLRRSLIIDKEWNFDWHLGQYCCTLHLVPAATYVCLLVPAVILHLCRIRSTILLAYCTCKLYNWQYCVLYLECWSTVQHKYVRSMWPLSGTVLFCTISWQHLFSWYVSTAGPATVDLRFVGPWSLLKGEEVNLMACPALGKAGLKR